MSDKTIDATIPPMTAIASGCSICEPAPMASDSGIIPAMVASAVIRIGTQPAFSSQNHGVASGGSFGPEALIRIEQQDAVLRHDADHHDQPHERGDVESLSRDQEREKHAAGGKQRRCENRRRSRERAELEQQHGKHQHHGQGQHDEKIAE